MTDDEPPIDRTSQSRCHSYSLVRIRVLQRLLSILGESVDSVRRHNNGSSHRSACTVLPEDIYISSNLYAINPAGLLPCHQPAICSLTRIWAKFSISYRLPTRI